MRWMTLILLTLLGACSGGGEAPLQAAAMNGTITELDGQNVDRSGVSVTLIETGESVLTGTDGRFAFRRIPVGTVTLAFSSGAQIAHNSDDSGSDESENETENEDDDGNPLVRGIEAGDDVNVKCSMDGGEVRDFSTSGSSRPRAESKVKANGLEAEVEVEGGDRQEIEVKVEGLAPGTVIDIFMDDPSDSVDSVRVASSSARADGEAKYRARGALPLGATTVADLAGVIVDVVLADTGEKLFTLEVPSIPSGIPGIGGIGEESRGKARLTAFEPGLEGYVEIRSRPEKGEQRFKMEAENLAPGTSVAFLIEDPANAGSFIRLAARTADAEGEAEISTQDELAMPLGVSDVSELVGLEVRVELDDGSATLLLAGLVPPLVADD